MVLPVIQNEARNAIPGFAIDHMRAKHHAGLERKIERDNLLCGNDHFGGMLTSPAGLVTCRS